MIPFPGISGVETKAIPAADAANETWCSRSRKVSEGLAAFGPKILSTEEEEKSMPGLLEERTFKNSRAWGHPAKIPKRTLP